VSLENDLMRVFYGRKLRPYPMTAWGQGRVPGISGAAVREPCQWASGKRQYGIRKSIA